MNESGSVRPITSASSAAVTGDIVVFVGGCDRSGTTLVSRLLGEQLSLVVLPEAYFHAVAYRRFGPGAAAVDALDHWRRRSWGLRGDDPLAEGVALAPYLRHRMADVYESRRGVRSPLRVVECTPENIEVGSILLDQFPSSRIVHLVRDPRAVVASLRAADFGPTSAQECARVWKQRIASGLALEMSNPRRVHRIKFEDLVKDPAALGELSTEVAEDTTFQWDRSRDLMLDPTSRAIQQRAEHPVDPSRIDSWRAVLSPAEIGTVEYECRELMLAFGYAPDGEHDDRTSTRRRLNATRSLIGELTIGSVRRFLRISRSRVRRA